MDTRNLLRQASKFYTHLYSFPRAVLKKSHKLCGLITEIHSLSEPRCPKSTGLVPLWRKNSGRRLCFCASLLASGGGWLPCRAWLADSSFKSLLLFSYDLFPGVSMSAFPSSYKDTSHTRSRAHVSPQARPHRDCTFNILLQQGHIVRFQRSQISTCCIILGMIQFNPQEYPSAGYSPT